MPKCGSNGVGKEGAKGGERSLKMGKKRRRKGGANREQKKCQMGGKMIGKMWATCGENGGKGGWVSTR